MKRAPAHIICIYLLVVSFRVNGYQYWNATANNISTVSHFLVDSSQDKIIVTAKNFLFQLDLDLKIMQNVLNVSLDAEANYACFNVEFRNERQCQNYHQVLLFPTATSTPTFVPDSNTPLSDTVLICGTNAFYPQCHYRLRSNLTDVHMATGVGFIPHDSSSRSVSLLTASNNRLASATVLINQQEQIAISHSPFNGVVQVATKSTWFNKSPQFVSIYEIGDYIYTFFREEPLESKSLALYSRVSRVCKNDMGVSDLAYNRNFHVFTSFMKARMTCISRGHQGSIPYYYDELQDTFLVTSPSYTGSGPISEARLYAIFTSPKNGPEGSAVCVFSFDSYPDDLGSVFQSSFLRRTGIDTFEVVANPNPPVCPSQRNLSEADSLYLMEGVAEQPDDPLVQLTGYSFQKLAVTSVQVVGGAIVQTLFLAGIKGDFVVLLKAFIDNEHKQHIVWEKELTSSLVEPQLPTVIQLEITNDVVYVGTTSGIHRVPVSDCSQYKDCCSCVAARDPYCAFDRSSVECVAVDGVNSSLLVQDLATGNADVCMEAPSSPTTVSVRPHPTAAPSSAPSYVDNKAPISGSTTQPSPSVFLPTAAGVSTRSSMSENTIIMATVFGFVGGMILGIISMAVVYNRKKFIWNRCLPKVEVPPPRNSDKAGDASGGSGKGQRARAAANNYSKQEEFTKNNCEMNPFPFPNVTRTSVQPICNLPNSQYPFSGGKQGPETPPLPPYTPTKPNPMVCNGGLFPASSPSSSQGAVLWQDGDDVDMPAPSLSTPQRRVNTDPPPPFTPLQKVNKEQSSPHTLHSSSKDTTPTQTPHSTPSPHKATPTDTPHSTPSPNKSGSTSSSQSTPKGKKSAPNPLTLSIPSFPSSGPQPAHTAHSHHLPFSPSQNYPPPRVHKHPYRRAYSCSQSLTPSSGHSPAAPANDHYPTLPHPKRQTPQSPTSGPSTQHQRAHPMKRPASAQNIHSDGIPLRAPSSPYNATTPTRVSGPNSPFSATSSSKAIVPSSPFSSSTPSAGTPRSTSSGGSTHFQFPSEGASSQPSRFPARSDGVPPHSQLSRLPGGRSEGGPSSLKSPYTRVEGGRNGTAKFPRDPNVKTTAVTVEATTNQERERYGLNMAVKKHTLDRKTKLPNGHSRTRAYPQRTAIEIPDAYIGCTDC